MSTPPIPEHIAKQRTAFLEGISSTTELLGLAYDQLSHSLLVLSSHKQGESMPPTAPAILSAWSVVDHAARLRGLLHQLPSVGVDKGTLPERKAFIEGTEDVKSLRDGVEHLHDEQLRALVNTEELIWGSLSWYFVDDFSTLESRVFLVMIGGPKKSDRRMVNPAGQMVGKNPNLVTLSAYGQSVCLTEIIDNAYDIARALERLFPGDFPAPGQGIFASLNCSPTVPTQGNETPLPAKRS